MVNLKIINPASGAIVMALGIFLYGTIEAFPFLDQALGEVLTVGLTIIGIVIYTALIRQFFHKGFLFPFLNNPVNSFVMGAWIAGISVLCNVIAKYFPELDAVLQVIAMINTFLWLLFLVCCIYNFKQLWGKPTKHSIHGVVLLSTVSTQSIVIVWIEQFSFLSSGLVISVISLGLLFYLCGTLLIWIRYSNQKNWSLTEDWTNTNCIIHGALSITGLAIVLSKVMSPLFIMFFWLFVFILLIIIEAIEITRAIKRVKEFGWEKGIFTYNISQWSRNFTFGMFYAFTMTIHETPNYMNMMYGFHEFFLTLWAWIVFVMLIGEIILWAESQFHFFERSRKDRAV
ncbi:hypothetical protein [Oceanobacillus sp. CF4.6]|uniref:hypothetical protein n=1 Tax=Oceanobacillus sp. CF4.6 TaxID=3373080 RepID=UPI003EE5CB27